MVELQGLNDRFACLGKAAAQLYGMRINVMRAYLASKNTGLHSESLLAYALDSMQVPRQPALKMRADRVRANGVVRREYCYIDTERRLPLFWRLISKHKVLKFRQALYQLGDRLRGIG